MPKYQYPIAVRIEVLIASKKQSGTASGPVFFGHLPTHEELIEAIQSVGRIVPGDFHIGTPEDLIEKVCEENGLGRVHVAGIPREWEHQAEIDTAFAAGRAAGPDSEEDSDDE